MGGTTNPPLNSDAGSGPADTAILREYISRLQSAIGVYNAKKLSDQNITVPLPLYNPQTKKRYFETAPIPLPRQFMSPLVQNGPYAQGPHKERKITSGWGDSRAYHVNTKDLHQGLDFAAPVGEAVMAAADGVITFVGAQLRPGAKARVINLRQPRIDASGNAVDSNGTVVPVGDLGYGGVFIQLRHNGDFQNYWTEYMHLSSITVNEGDHVNAGQVIGNVGRSGGATGITTGPHLHFQVRFLGIIVRPTPLVPNYWPGHFEAGQQDTDPATGIAALNTLGATLGAATSASMTVGMAIIAAQAANQIQCLDRATLCGNFTGPQLKAQQSAQSDLVSKNLAVHTSAMYDAFAKFQAELPVVQGAMRFNFDTGLWSDGRPV